MRLSWKIYLVLSSVVLLAALFLSTAVTYREAQHALGELRHQQRLLASLAASQVEAGYHEQIWPFEMLASIADEKSVVAWQIIDGAGAIILQHGDSDRPSPEQIASWGDTAGSDVEQPQLMPRAGTENETWFIPMRMRTEAKPWHFALTFQKADVYRHIERMCTVNLLIAVGVILPLLPLSLYVTGHFLKPLLSLTAAVKQMKAGELNVDLPPCSADEVGQLVRAFREMAESICERDARIQEHMAAIELARDELETRVEERTAALESRKQELETEIAERWRAEEALREAQEWLRTLIHYAPEAITILDPSQDRYVDVNENATRLFARSRNELLSLGPIQLSPAKQPDGRSSGELVRERIAEVLQGECPVFEWNYARADGHEIPCEVRLIRLARDGKWFVRASIADISARKKAEKKLKELNEQLVETSRHAGMAEIATSVLHNVGNVLNSVNTSAAIAVERANSLPINELNKVAQLIAEHEDSLATFFTADPRGKAVPRFFTLLAERFCKQRTEMLDILSSLSCHIEHIKRIVRAQQTYAKVGCLVESIPLVELVQNAVSFSSAAMERHLVKVTCHFGRVGVVQVDKHRVLQILINLLTNAKQALANSTEQKRIDVRAEIDDQGDVAIAISDNGKGILAENLAKIFQYGFTTRKDGNGFGLHSGALAAKEMGGQLTVRSDGPGQGATFTLRVPQASSAAAPAPSRAGSPQEAPAVKSCSTALGDSTTDGIGPENIVVDSPPLPMSSQV